MSDNAEQAWGDAHAAAAHAVVTVRELGAGDVAEAAALLASIWGTPTVEPPLMVALSHSGAYVAGAFDGAAMVGACVGYFSQPLGETLHSHVAGVAPGTNRRGIGVALKLHQRAWALERALTHITWTFDPLVSRNAAFNLQRLGVDIAEYLVDFYGEMSDGVNAGQGSDRLFARWSLDAPWPPPREVGRELDPTRASAVLSSDGDGAPHPRDAPRDATVLTVAVPPDIEELRRSDPTLAARWRHAVRDAMAPLLERGYVIQGFHDHRYLLGRP
jgi:predicted GNAT superfamily acetyltransferase